MNYLYIGCLLLISSCTAIAPVAKFDNYEYALINKIYTRAEVYKAGCDNAAKTKANFESLTALSMEAVNYSSDIPDNLDTVQLVVPLNKMVSDANIKFNTAGHTVSYCLLKLDNIELTASIIKHAIAQKRGK